MSLDINSKSLDTVEAHLSNFAMLGVFEFRGFKCSSIEGPLQALNIRETYFKERVYQMDPRQYSKIHKKAHHADWQMRKNRHLFDSDGKKIERLSQAYRNYVRELFDAAFYGRPTYRNALDLAAGEELKHSIGKHDPYETVLTNNEFFEQLYRLQVKLLTEN